MELTASIFALVKELDDFYYELSVLDRVWNVLCPDKEGKWHYLHVNKYNDTFYIAHVDGDGGSIEVEQKKGVRAIDSMGAPSYPVETHGQLATVWETLIESACKWLKVTRKDWIKANE